MIQLNVPVRFQAARIQALRRSLAILLILAPLARAELAQPALDGEVLLDPEGFATRWLAVGPLSRQAFRAVWADLKPRLQGQEDPAGLATVLGNRNKRKLRAKVLSVGGPEALVSLGRLPSGTSMILWAHLQVDQPGPYRIKMGASRRTWLMLDGQEIALTDKALGAELDDTVLPVELSAGAHTLALRVHRRKRGSHSILLRVLNINNGPPSGVRFFLPGLDQDTARRWLAESLMLSPERRVRPLGFGVRLGLERRGTVPARDHRELTIGVSAEGATVHPLGPWEGPLPPIPYIDPPPKPPLLTPLDGERKIVPLSEPLGLAEVSQAVWEGEVRPKGTGSALVVTVKGPGGRVLRRERIALMHRLRWSQRVFQARQDLGRAQGVDQDALDSLAYLADKMEHHLLEGVKDWPWLERETKDLARMAGEAAGGQNPYQTKRGPFYRAYRSLYDGRLQPYSVYVPPNYNPEKRAYPLVIALHGLDSGSHLTLRRVFGEDPQTDHPTKETIRSGFPELRNHGFLVAAAWGYGKAAYSYFGEHDVMHVIDLMSRHYRVDPRRVYITGLSLGGLGSYHISLHFPDRFAAAMPLCGFSSIKLYNQIRPYQKRWWEKLFLDSRDATSYAENALHLPMFVVHGTQDGPHHARAMTDRLEELKYRVSLDTPDMGHHVWGYAWRDGKAFQLFRQFRRPDRPREVRLRSYNRRYNSSYWVRLDQWQKPLHAADVRGQVSSDGGAVLVRTENVRALTLLAERMPSFDKGSRQVTIDGERLEWGEGDLYLSRASGAWARAEAPSFRPWEKGGGLWGPLDDILYDPHIYVYGTADPAQTETNRRRAQEDAWAIHNYDIRLPVKADHELTDDDIRRYHIVLYGGPGSNSVWARALPQGRTLGERLPVRFEAGGVRLGGRAYTGPSVGVAMVYPNPLNPERYLAIYAGVNERGTWLSRYLPRYLPDYVVYDEGIANKRGGRILTSQRELAGGYFDEGWKLAP